MRRTGTEWLARFRRSIERFGIRIEAGTEDARVALDSGGEAVTLAFEGAFAICFASREPTASSVLEELAHVLQQLRQRFVDEDVRVMRELREIEAKSCLDEQAEKLEIPEAEREETRRQIADRREKLLRYREMGL